MNIRSIQPEDRPSARSLAARLALDYEGMDVDAYRAERLKAFVGMLHHFGLVKPPVV